MAKKQQAAEAQAEVQAEDYAEVATDGLQGSETLAEEGQESGAEGEGQPEEVRQQVEKACEGRKYIISEEGGRYIVFRKN